MPQATVMTTETFHLFFSILQNTQHDLSNKSCCQTAAEQHITLHVSWYFFHYVLRKLICVSHIIRLNTLDYHLRCFFIQVYLKNFVKCIMLQIKNIYGDVSPLDMKMKDQATSYIINICIDEYIYIEKLIPLNWLYILEHTAISCSFWH